MNKPIETILILVLAAMAIAIGCDNQNNKVPKTQGKQELCLHYDYVGSRSAGWSLELKESDGITTLTWRGRNWDIDDFQNEITITMTFQKERADKFWKSIIQTDPLQLTDAGHFVVDGLMHQITFQDGERSNKFTIHEDGGGFDSPKHKQLCETIRTIHKEAWENMGAFRANY